MPSCLRTGTLVDLKTRSLNLYMLRIRSKLFLLRATARSFRSPHTGDDMPRSRLEP